MYVGDGLMMLVMAWLIVAASLTMGVSHGYQAETAADADIYLDGEELVVGENRSDISIEGHETEQPPEMERFDRLPDIPTPMPEVVRDPMGEAANTTVAGLYWTTMEAMVPVMDASATWTYQNRGWLPLSVLQGVLNVAAFGPLVGVVWLQVQRVREVKG